MECQVLTGRQTVLHYTLFWFGSESIRSRLQLGNFWYLHKTSRGLDWWTKQSIPKQVHFCLHWNCNSNEVWIQSNMELLSDKPWEGCCWGDWMFDKTIGHSFPDDLASHNQRRKVYVRCCECQNKNQTCCHLRWICSRYGTLWDIARVLTGTFQMAEQRRHSRLFCPWYCQISQPASCCIKPWYIFYPWSPLCLNNLMIINLINEWEVMYIIYIKLLFKKLENIVFLTLPIVYSLRYSNVKVAKSAGWL